MSTFMYDSWVWNPMGMKMWEIKLLTLQCLSVIYYRRVFMGIIGVNDD